MREDVRRLQDILEAITLIEKYTAGGRGGFDQSDLIRVWVVHHIEIIGEAARAMTAELRAAHPEIPWAPISAMRNILVHQYFDIDPEEVWSVVARDLPALKQQITNILGALKPEGSDDTASN